MKKRVASIALVSALGVGAVSLTPAFAATADQASQRVSHISNALKGLVSDGTLTQAQADKVATTLDKALPQRGPGGKGHHLLEDAAKVLGMTVQQLKTAMGSTKSLADVAATKGISRATLIEKLLAAMNDRLAAEVEAGRLTQEQADARKAEATERIGEAVDRKGLPPRPDHRGPGGRGGPGGPGGPGGEAPQDGSAAPSSSNA